MYVGSGAKAQQKHPKMCIVSLAENFPLIKEILGWSCQNEELAKN